MNTKKKKEKKNANILNKNVSNDKDIKMYIINQTLKLTWNCKYDKDIKMYIIITKYSSWHSNSISTLKTWNFLNK